MNRAGATWGPAPSALERLFELSLDGLCIFDAKGAFHRVSPAFADALGWSEENLLGRPHAELLHPDDAASTDAAMRTLAAGGDVIDFCNRYRRPDGTYREFEWRARGGDEGFVYGVARDVTGRRRQEVLMAETQKSARIGGWELDFRTNELYWTDETYRIHETSPDDFVPTLDSAVAFYADRSLPIIAAAVERGRTHGEGWDLELQLVTAKGRSIDVRATGNVVLEGGVPVKVYGSFQDVTERRHLEERVRHSQKLEAIGRLAGGVAHDFNNLLTVILGNVELLQEGSIGAADRSSVDAIREASEQASRLTAQLLAFARRQVLEPQAIRLDERVRSLATMIERLIGEDVRLTTGSDPDLWPIFVDVGQIEQVLMNLAVNARDAMPRGGSLRIATRNVVVAPSDATAERVAAGDYVELSMADDGIGITPEVMDHLFEPFFTTKRFGKGTGLGLATCHGIVRQNQGFIRVESEVGRGSTFRLYFPRSRVDVTAVAAPPASESPSGTETVLVVEDEPSVREVGVSALRRQGYTVLAAADAETALTLAEETGHRVDLLVSDVVLPRMGGQELAAELRARMPGLAGLFASGYAGDRFDPEQLTAGDASFLQKPYDSVSLGRAARAALDARPSGKPGTGGTV